MKGMNSRNMSFCFVSMGWHCQHINVVTSLPTTHTSISPAAIPLPWGVSSHSAGICSAVCSDQQGQGHMDRVLTEFPKQSIFWSLQNSIIPVCNSRDKEIKQLWMISFSTREGTAFPISSSLLLYPRTPESDEREIKWTCFWWSAMTQAKIQQTEWQGLCGAVTDGTSDLRAHNSVWWGGSCNLFCLMWAQHSPRAICKLPGSFVLHKVWAPCWIPWL